MSALESNLTPEIYQGQFGTFTITDRDRQGVIVYRSALMVAAVSFAIATLLVLLPESSSERPSPNTLSLVTWLYVTFSVALGIALITIHIYMTILHRALQLFWAIGCASAIGFSLYYREPIGSIVYEHPLTILGIGFTFAALTGIFFKEAFCFNRFETKILTFLVPILLLGHLTSLLTLNIEAILLTIWSGLFFIFASRKAFQLIPDDIGDKSVFKHLENQK
ncbi:DUF2301 domain-containing membrane protein [Chamaesiphon minutus]|uniref:Uncharacterized integral membrane protein n=1 Tax=Chamaesiphon minutus (strain ATCC 27169 / PCC 6605) TaxID=1173020 RepID=K9UL12_CHAP6|nr:DUF2301 domain-containing membrane protein [Chamaesiphon minutus]AFY95151.1 uncharacterized integral membrane protein [Chamaesiphon minutus PCC 6605]